MSGKKLFSGTQLDDLYFGRLRVEALKEALQQKKKMSDTRALAAAHQLLGEEYPTTQSLLNHAAMICKDYFSQNYLNGLVID